jgi:hypothetical protein
MTTVGFLYDPERGNCIARFTEDLAVFDCCRDGRQIGTLNGNAIYGLDGVFLGHLSPLAPGGRLPAAFRRLVD